MSRQFSRIRPPFDDDSLPATKEELQQPTKAAPAETPATRPAHAQPTNPYFHGKYAPENETDLAKLLCEFRLPESLAPYIRRLLHVTKSQGITAALTLLKANPDLDRAHAPSTVALHESLRHPPSEPNH
jgi:hypothetical protein